MLWEEIRSYCQHAIQQQVVLASPLHSSSSVSLRNKGVVADAKKQSRVKKSKRKSKEVGSSDLQGWHH